jgi:hypothetical protein
VTRDDVIEEVAQALEQRSPSGIVHASLVREMKADPTAPVLTEKSGYQHLAVPTNDGPALAPALVQQLLRAYGVDAHAHAADGVRPG